MWYCEHRIPSWNGVRQNYKWNYVRATHSPLVVCRKSSTRHWRERFFVEGIFDIYVNMKSLLSSARTHSIYIHRMAICGNVLISRPWSECLLLPEGSRAACGLCFFFSPVSFCCNDLQGWVPYRVCRSWDLIILSVLMHVNKKKYWTCFYRLQLDNLHTRVGLSFFQRNIYLGVKSEAHANDGRKMQRSCSFLLLAAVNRRKLINRMLLACFFCSIARNCPLLIQLFVFMQKLVNTLSRVGNYRY